MFRSLLTLTLRCARAQQLALLHRGGDAGQRCRHPHPPFFVRSPLPPPSSPPPPPPPGGRTCAPFTDTVNGQGYDWLLIDTQHGPMDREHMGIMISAVHAGGCKAFVRVGIGDRDGIQCVLPTRSMTATPSPHLLVRVNGLTCGAI